MKYISLIKMMAVYGSFVKERRALKALSSEACGRRWVDGTDYTPFSISMGVQNEQNFQSVYSLRFSDGFNYRYAAMYNTPERINMLPILELDWLHAINILDDKTYKILQQIAYLDIVQIVAWHEVVQQAEHDPNDYIEELETAGAVIEVDEILDAPVILSSVSIPSITLPRYHTWSIVFMYASDFYSLLTLCSQQSSSNKMFYVHLPMLLSLFMVNYYGNDLADWTKDNRLDCESSINNLINFYDMHLGSFTAHETCTYGTCSTMTSIDTALVVSVFRMIYNKLHVMNSDIGLISFYAYKNIRGPERTNASVRLTNMDITWDKEIERARLEKEQAAEDE